jgi:hypothetical protein
MSLDKNVLGSEQKEVLRVALDKAATSAYKQMTDRLKKESPFLKIQPSVFISFLVADFFTTYFEKDLGILVAEFFDSQSYYEDQLRKAKSGNSFEQAMIQTLSTIKKIKSRKRGKMGRKRKTDKGLNAANHEAL